MLEPYGSMGKRGFKIFSVGFAVGWGGFVMGNGFSSTFTVSFEMSEYAYLDGYVGLSIRVSLSLTACWSLSAAGTASVSVWAICGYLTKLLAD